MQTTVIDCPLRTCDWRHDATPPPPSADTLASVFGVGVMASAAYAQHVQRTEDALRAHFETHKLEEWVTEITALKYELAALRS